MLEGDRRRQDDHDRGPRRPRPGGPVQFLVPVVPVVRHAPSVKTGRGGGHPPAGGSRLRPGVEPGIAAHADDGDAAGSYGRFMLLTTESQTPMARRDQLAFVVFGTWLVTGLFVDGWAHNHQKPETFFTPWHAVLYSGFGAAVLWGVIDGRRRPWSPPAGQRLTNVGAVLFGIGGAADMVWHQVFGIEVNLAALLSPTHLLLMTGGILAASGPFRA